MIQEDSIHNKIVPDMDMSNIQGILCIDCWDTLGDFTEDFFAKIDSKIDFSSIHHIVVANYQSPLDNSDNSLNNTYDLYHDNDESIINSIFVRYAIRPEHSLPIHYTSAWLKTKLHNDLSFAILKPDHFVKHVNSQVPGLNKWLVIGGLWQVCAHRRPLGFKNLVDLPFDFYIAPWSMYKKDEDLQQHHNELSEIEILNDPNFEWAKVGPEMYKLAGRKVPE